MSESLPNPGETISTKQPTRMPSTSGFVVRIVDVMVIGIIATMATSTIKEHEASVASFPTKVLDTYSLRSGTIITAGATVDGQITVAVTTGSSVATVTGPTTCLQHPLVAGQTLTYFASDKYTEEPGAFTTSAECVQFDAGALAKSQAQELGVPESDSVGDRLLWLAPYVIQAISIALLLFLLYRTFRPGKKA